MAFKLRTSKKTELILSKIEKSENLPFYTTVKLAIAMSLKCDKKLEEKDFHTNIFGKELNRQTITGDYDELFKCLLEVYENKHLTDDEFFPMYIKAHIDRGAALLEQEYKYTRNFLVHLNELDKGI